MAPGSDPDTRASTSDNWKHVERVETPEHSDAFEELVAMLRTREEWSFVEREIDIRLAR